MIKCCLSNCSFIISSFVSNLRSLCLFQSHEAVLFFFFFVLIQNVLYWHRSPSGIEFVLSGRQAYSNMCAQSRPTLCDRGL